MLGNRKKKKQQVVDTIFSAGTVIEGKVNHTTSLRIDGKVYGSIVCEGDVHVGKTGYVETSIQANNIIISGEVEGDLQALEKVHIHPNASLQAVLQQKVLSLMTEVFLTERVLFPVIQKTQQKYPNPQNKQMGK